MFEWLPRKRERPPETRAADSNSHGPTPRHRTPVIVPPGTDSQYTCIDTSVSCHDIAPMAAKTQQLQIRVTPQQKAGLKRQAGAAGLDLSSYVLSRLLPPERDRFAGILRALEPEADRRFALAELHDFLHGCAPGAFAEAVARADWGALPQWVQNYVAALVEQAADQKHVAPPPWVGDVAPLATPRFATELKSLRLHLLRSAPVPFKRRNIFVDTSVGQRL